VRRVTAKVIATMEEFADVARHTIRATCGDEAFARSCRRFRSAAFETASSDDPDEPAVYAIPWIGRELASGEDFTAPATVISPPDAAVISPEKSRR